jgi:hypothetical protein
MAQLIGMTRASASDSMIGPRTQKYIPDIWLKRIFAMLAFYVGLRRYAFTPVAFFGACLRWSRGVHDIGFNRSHYAKHRSVFQS